MKRTLVIVLALILVLALAAGCGNGGGEPQDGPESADAGTGLDITIGDAPDGDGGGSALPGWPTADLPPGFPVYPSGVIEAVEMVDEDSLGIRISGTNEADFDAYLKALEAAGWEQKYPTDPGLSAELTKDMYWVGLNYFEGGNVGVAVYHDSGGGADPGGGEAPSGGNAGGEAWPTADLPPGFPVYPGGVITKIEGSLDIMAIGLTITITGTDEATRKAYSDTIRDWTNSEDIYWVTLLYDLNDPSYVEIQVVKQE